MKDKLFGSINVASYFLWEYSKSENALGLWCCVEDIASDFQKNGITDRATLEKIISLGRDDAGYIEFIRNISYKIYSYTGNIDHYKNWFLTERLLDNGEWKDAVLTAAYIYDNMKKDDEIIRSIRSDEVRNYYLNNSDK